MGGFKGRRHISSGKRQCNQMAKGQAALPQAILRLFIERKFVLAKVLRFAYNIACAFSAAAKCAISLVGRAGDS